MLKDLAQDIAGGISTCIGTCIGVVNELTVAGSNDAGAPSNSDRPQYAIPGNSDGGDEVVSGEAVVQDAGSSGGGFGDCAEAANSEFPRSDDEDFRIIERIGGGGQADVYRGHQVSLDRKVAIKIMDRQQRLAKDELRRRFHEVAPSVPAELEAICRKCLQKKPEDRYASCAEVAEELGCRLKGKPVEALVECEAEQPPGLDRENAEQTIGAPPPDPKLKDSATTAPRGRIPDKPDLPEPPTPGFFTRGIAAIGVSSVVLVLAMVWSTGAGTAAVVVRPAEGATPSGELPRLSVSFR